MTEAITFTTNQPGTQRQLMRDGWHPTKAASGYIAFSWVHAEWPLNPYRRPVADNDPKQVETLLRAMAASEDAKTNRHDTILIAAAEMIAAMARRL